MKRTLTTHLCLKAMRQLTSIALAALSLTVCIALFTSPVASGADAFQCFDANRCEQALARSLSCQRDQDDRYDRDHPNDQDKDYTIKITPQDSEVVVLSIHGGSIEPGTSIISQHLADRNHWSRYDFNAHARQKCLQRRTNFAALHITATRFDDPDAIELVSHHSKSIAIHGARFSETTARRVCVGGRNQAQIETFIASLNRRQDELDNALKLAAIDATKDTQNQKCLTSRGEELQGTDPCNIVNVNASHQGLQLEFSRNVRTDLIKNAPDAQKFRQVVYGAIADAMATDETRSSNQGNQCDRSRPGL